MRGILLISHGYYAEHFKNSLKMIAGDVQNVYACCLEEAGGPEKFEKDLEKLEPELAKYDKILVFADLLGGSPCNTAFKRYIQNEKFDFIAGMNFGMVLTAILAETMTVDDLIQTGKDAIVDVRAYANEMAAGDDEDE